MSWAQSDSFSVTTANGFEHPAGSLLIHTIVTIGVSLLVMHTVWNIRLYVMKHARSFTESATAVPPVQAYTVEIHGLRVQPPVTESELKTVLLDPFQEGQPNVGIMSVCLPMDVTDVVDLVEQHRELKVQLARYKQQFSNDESRPEITIGRLSWLFIGDKVDAITYLEGQVQELDNMITAAHSPEAEQARFGTGTAYVTFTTCTAAASFVETYADFKSALRNGHLNSDVQGVVLNPNNWGVAMAPKPEDIDWRNLRYTRSQILFMVVACCLGLLVTFTFILTPLVFVQILLLLGDATIEGTVNAPEGEQGDYERYYRAAGGSGTDEYWAHHYLRVLANIASPLFLLLVNFFLMPYIVHFAVKNCGFRSVSARNRAAFSIICTLMLFNVLVIPALSLSGLNEFFELSKSLSFDQILAVMLLYGSSSAFFIDYVVQVHMHAFARHITHIHTFVRCAGSRMSCAPHKVVPPTNGACRCSHAASHS